MPDPETRAEVSSCNCPEGLCVAWETLNRCREERQRTGMTRVREASARLKATSRDPAWEAHMRDISGAPQSVLDAAAQVREHQRDGAVMGFGRCVRCGGVWPCAVATPQHMQDLRGPDESAERAVAIALHAAWSEANERVGFLDWDHMARAAITAYRKR